MAPPGEELPEGFPVELVREQEPLRETLDITLEVRGQREVAVHGDHADPLLEAVEVLDGRRRLFSLGIGVFS